MFRRAARSRRHSVAGLIVLTAASACGGSRPAAPVTPASAGGTTSASGAIELPANEAFNRAVSRGTRTTTGAPGPKYWQQWTDYRLEAELNPISKRLTGQGSLTYHNRSPNPLSEVYVQLLHNLFAPGRASQHRRALVCRRDRAQPGCSAGPGVEAERERRCGLPRGRNHHAHTLAAPDPVRWLRGVRVYLAASSSAGWRAARWPGR